jgi:hypothetical protein
VSTRSSRRDRSTRLAKTWQGINRGLRGRGGAIAFLATVGVLGIASGMALASGNSGGDVVGSVPEGCTRVDGPGNDNTGVDMGTTVINGITLQFTQTGQGTMHWEVVDPPGAIFVGTITMKGGPDLDGLDWTYTAGDNASSGDIHTPVNPHNGNYYGISHAQSCGDGDTTTNGSPTSSTVDTTLYTTLPDTTTTVTEPDTTSTITGTDTTSTITLPDTTTTVTDPDVTTTITEPNTTSTVTEDMTTTTTAPDTTLTTTIPCFQQASREITPRSLTTITVPGSTVTQTEPGSTITQTEPGSTETITENGTTQTVTQPGSTITQTQPGSTFTTTIPGSTVVSTIPGTTQTVTDCTSSTTTETSSTESTSTGAVLGTSTSGGGTTTKLAAEKSEGSGKEHGDAVDPVAAAATPAAGAASGSLPFTGFHVPVLILFGIGMGVVGLMLRRRLASLD